MNATSGTNGGQGVHGGGGGATIGLALAGGVVEGGFYEIGVLCALEEALGGLALDRLGTYVGVSSGALVCSLLANGVSPRTLSRAIVSQAEPELDLRPEIIFTPAWGEYVRRLAALPRVALDALRRTLDRPADRSAWATLLELGAAIPTGIFDGSSVEAYLARALSTGGRANDFRALAARDTRLRVVAVALDSSELVAFGDASTAQVPIARAVRASMALPGLFCPVEIDGRHYIDGVARRTMHASVALREGARLVFCINPIVPVDVTPPVGEADAHGRGTTARPLVSYGLPAVLSQTFRTLVHSRLETGFKSYEHLYPDADLVLIEPRLSDHRLFFSNVFSFSNRQGVCEHGYQSTRRWLAANADRLAPVLARHGLALRREVLAEPRTLYPERRATAREDTMAVGHTDMFPVQRPASGAEPVPPAPARQRSVPARGIGAVLAQLDRALERVERAFP